MDERIARLGEGAIVGAGEMLGAGETSLFGAGEMLGAGETLLFGAEEGTRFSMFSPHMLPKFKTLPSAVCI